MEKVYFHNENTNLSVSVFSGKDLLLTILPGFEDWIEFPLGKSEIVVSSKLFGINFKKEIHWIDIEQGVNNVNIRLDPTLDKYFPIELPSILLIGISSFINSMDLTTSDLNFAYFKINSEELPQLINLFLFCLIVPVYGYLTLKCYRRIKALGRIFKVN